MFKRSKVASFLTNLALVLVSTAVTVGLIEWAIRGLDLLVPLRDAALPAVTANVQEGDRTDEEHGSSRWILHPYRGLTPRPLVVLPEEERMASRQNVLGIRAYMLDPRVELTSEMLVIGVFGGSVARQVGLVGAESVRREIAAALGKRAPQVKVVNFAVSGYKQPQQLATLAEALLLGIKLDVVVNLDGYNEMVLGIENAQYGHHPLYPSNGQWVAAIGRSNNSLSDAQIELSADIIRFQRQARELRNFISTGWGKSQLVTAFVGWRVLAAERRAVGAEMRLRQLPLKLAEEDLFDLDDPCLKESTPEVCASLALEIWADSSRAMKALAQGFGLEYVHFLQPNQYVEGSKPLSEKEKEQAWNPDRLWSRTAIAVYPLLRQRGKKLVDEGIPFYDLTQVFAGRTETIYADTCCHVNIHGSELLGQEVGRLVVSTLGARKLETYAATQPSDPPSKKVR